LVAIAIRQAHIHKHQIEGFVRDEVLRLGQAAGRAHAAMLATKNFAQNIPDDHFIIEDEDLFRAT